MTVLPQELIIDSNDRKLQGRLYKNNRKNSPTLIISHGLPDSKSGVGTFASTYSVLCERLSVELDFNVLFVTFSGFSKNAPNFSIKNWIEDLDASIDYISKNMNDNPIYILGFSVGAVIALNAASKDPRVKACAIFGVPYSLDALISPVESFIESLRLNGFYQLEKTKNEKKDFIGLINVEELISSWPDKPLIVGLGEDDDVVGIQNTKRIVSLIPKDQTCIMYPFANHRLRYDPRVIASIIGWFGRLFVGKKTTGDE